MRCKACNAEMKDYELTTRTVKDNGEVYKVDEDLCMHCRQSLLEVVDELEIDPTSLGLDVMLEEVGHADIQGW